MPSIPPPLRSERAPWVRFSTDWPRCILCNRSRTSLGEYISFKKLPKTNFKVHEIGCVLTCVLIRQKHGNGPAFILFFVIRLVYRIERLHPLHQDKTIEQRKRKKKYKNPVTAVSSYFLFSHSLFVAVNVTR